MSIGFIDVNFFEGQARRRFDKNILGKTPYVVANVKHGRIVALNEAAKKRQLYRDIKLWDAQQMVQNLQVIDIPLDIYGKPDRIQLDNASIDFQNCVRKIIETRKWCIPVDFGCQDEAFLDLTYEVDNFIAQNPHPLIYCNELFWNTYFEMSNDRIELDRVRKIGPLREYLATFPKIYYSSYIMTQFIRDIEYHQDFQVSAGIGHDRFHAKIAGELNGPNSLTYLNTDSFDRICEDLNINQITGLKRQTGARLMNHFGIEKVSELRNISFRQLLIFFDMKREKTLEIRQKIFGKLPQTHKDNYPVEGKL